MLEIFTSLVKIQFNFNIIKFIQGILRVKYIFNNCFHHFSVMAMQFSPLYLQLNVLIHYKNFAISYYCFNGYFLKKYYLILHQIIIHLNFLYYLKKHYNMMFFITSFNFLQMLIYYVIRIVVMNENVSIKNFHSIHLFMYQIICKIDFYVEKNYFVYQIICID